MTDTVDGQVVEEAPAVRGNLVPYGPRIPFLPLDDIRQLAEVFKESGYFRDTRDVAQAVTKIWAGQELGVPPFASMRGIHIVEGQPQLGAVLIAAKIDEHPVYDYAIREHTNETCTVEFFKAGVSRGSVTWTMDDARRAGLIRPRSGWEKYPRAMLFARALTEGSRSLIPGAFGGAVYAEGEIEEPIRGDSSAGPDAASDTSNVSPQVADVSAPGPADEPAAETEADATPAAGSSPDTLSEFQLDAIHGFMQTLAERSEAFSQGFEAWARRNYEVDGIEQLTAAQADDLIQRLQARTSENE